MVKEVATVTISVIVKRLITYWNCLPYTKYVIGINPQSISSPFLNHSRFEGLCENHADPLENEQYRKHLASRGDKQNRYARIF